MATHQVLTVYNSEDEGEVDPIQLDLGEADTEELLDLNYAFWYFLPQNQRVSITDDLISKIVMDVEGLHFYYEAEKVKRFLAEHIGKYVTFDVC